MAFTIEISHWSIITESFQKHKVWNFYVAKINVFKFLHFTALKYFRYLLGLFSPSNILNIPFPLNPFWGYVLKIQIFLMFGLVLQSDYRQIIVLTDVNLFDISVAKIRHTSLTWNFFVRIKVCIFPYSNIFYCATIIPKVHRVPNQIFGW